MFQFKRLYRFMLQSFMPLFVMTFLICLFIVLMQFLWRYIDDLVGKGLGVDVLAELFLYAALTMVPMALPLSILLASLMTFGNLGERFELTAMKASGISLTKTMRPLIVLMCFVAVGAFFFQDKVMPVAQARMWTLLYSMRQKSPELDIPEGAFYDQIPGFNLYVKEKNRDNGKLYDLMIYDVTRGFDNTRVILADSGDLAVTPDKTHLYFTLYDGELFENLREQSATTRSANMPYRKEAFDRKQILIAFDANFNRMDEGGMRNQYVGKNIAELRHTIDSINTRLDSIGAIYGHNIREISYLGVSYFDENQPAEYVNYTNPDGSESTRRVGDPRKPVPMDEPLNIDTLFMSRGAAMYKSYLNHALSKAGSMRQEYEFKSYTMDDDNRILRRHGIELMKKFTLSLACLVFFFIGAPLGAIIRKGGLGMPIVISVLLFIFYYIIDNSGMKLARDGRLEVWEGVWLSTAVLLPLGIFLTYKAVNDSDVFNRDAYANFFNRLLGRKEKRHIDLKEVIMEEVELPQAMSMLQELSSACTSFNTQYPGRQNYMLYWLHGFNRRTIQEIKAQTEIMVTYLANSRSKHVIAQLNRYPVIRSLWLYHPTGSDIVAWLFILIFPIGIPIYLAALRQQRILKEEFTQIAKLNAETEKLLERYKSEN